MSVVGLGGLPLEVARAGVKAEADRGVLDQYEMGAVSRVRGDFDVCWELTIQGEESPRLDVVGR